MCAAFTTAYFWISERENRRFGTLARGLKDAPSRGVRVVSINAPKLSQTAVEFVEG
jgi:hypothetical protein